MTTPAEKDAMALAVLDADSPYATNCPIDWAADLAKARAHLAARVAEDADEIFRLNTRLVEETNRADRAEAELAAVRNVLTSIRDSTFRNSTTLRAMAQRGLDAARGAG